MACQGRKGEVLNLCEKHCCAHVGVFVIERVTFKIVALVVTVDRAKNDFLTPRSYNKPLIRTMLAISKTFMIRFLC